MTESDSKALERFVVENDDLLAIESRIGRFNIFDALGLARAEIRHSNFLAFILDPAESHGQGQLFLKAVLMDLLKYAPDELRPLSPIDLDGTDLRGVDIKREWKNIDVLITCKAPPFAVVVENKVDSQEHSEQLSRYQATMKSQYPDLPSLFVLLTPNGDEPSEDSWISYTYADIHRVLKRVRDTNHNAIGEDVLVFVDHYLNLLGTQFMNDDKIDELCRQIYKNHRQALDLIWKRVGSSESATIDEARRVLEEDERWKIFRSASKELAFLPQAWLAWLHPNGLDAHPCISVYLRPGEGSLSYTVYVSPMSDTDKRKVIIATLRNECSNVGLMRCKRDSVSGQWAQITTVVQFFKWDEGEDPDPAAVRVSVKSMLDDLYPKLEKLALVLKPLEIFPSSAK